MNQRLKSNLLRGAAALVLLLTAFPAAGQGLDSLLSNIATNNPLLVAERQAILAQQTHLKTGLSLRNPEVKADYMIGTPAATAGNQFDFTISQQVDFPTVYRLRRQLAGTQSLVLPNRMQALRQDVLVEAKQKGLEVIHLNHRRAELYRRYAATEQVNAGVQKQLEQGEATALDANKAALMLLNVQNELAQVEIDRKRLIEELIGFNGGKALELTDTLYPPESLPPDFAAFEAEVETNDPVRRQLEGEAKAAEQQVALTKALALPQFQTGYHHQTLLGQQFNGAFISLTIPLWENRYRVETQREFQLYRVRLLESHRTEHYHELKGLYDEHTKLGTQLGNYRRALSSLQSTSLLNKALEFGEITVVQYYWELTLYYQTQDQYRLTLLRYQQIQAQLLKHLL